MKHLKLILMLTIVLLSSTVFAASQYFYSPKEISVRSEPKRNGAQLTTLKPGDEFKIIKWNSFNTRIRLSNGREGFIDKELVAHLAANPNSTGRLASPIELTLTSDASNVQNDGGGQISVATVGGEGGSEVTNNGESEVDTLIADSDPSATARFAKATIAAALKKRAVATTCGKGSLSGNKSKCMCAAAVKEAMVSAGLCEKYPPGHAINLHTDSNLTNSCRNMKFVGTQGPRSVKDGCVIVYKNHNGKTKKFGHVETKLTVTSAIKQQLKGQLNVNIGQVIFCSDYCSSNSGLDSTTRKRSVAGVYCPK